MENITTTTLCPTCHQEIKAEYYFCPNCGTKLKQAPLSTTFISQFALYAFSIILPSICFLFVSKWHGISYLKSKDPKEKIIGAIACVLLAISTVLTIYFAYTITLNVVQSQINAVNTDFVGF